MRTARSVSTLLAVAALTAAAVPVCPCPRPPSPHAEHACCAPLTRVAATRGCCETVPAADAAPTAPAPTTALPALVAVLSPTPVPAPGALLPGDPVVSASPPPLVLRI